MSDTEPRRKSRIAVPVVWQPKCAAVWRDEVVVAVVVAVSAVGYYYFVAVVTKTG